MKLARTGHVVIWPRQLALFMFVCRYHAEHNYGPSFAECGRHCDLSPTNGVKYAVIKLRGLGMLDYDPQAARSLRPAAGVTVT